WAALQKAGMAKDFSWRASAEKYAEAYQKLVAESAAPARDAYQTAAEKPRRRIRDEQAINPIVNGEAT
ncbi:MAG TPA: hypothetical protein PLR65_05135, partial [Anaerolineales bacterium]|nr:hypothetical protein [Anaerolineales bacterium]